ncbi:MAG TPA: hypothetical protein VE868_00300 [Balneolaceae bacterium]|nr:hypothetical protein [Balneolaceae bacterium]
MFAQKTGGKKAQKKINSSGCQRQFSLIRFQPAAFKQIFFGLKPLVMSVDKARRAEKPGGVMIVS